jgi:uridylate kinase
VAVRGKRAFVSFFDRKFKRILLKLSGEALMGTRDYGIDYEYLFKLVEAIASLADAGVQLAIVVGGGNIYRGSRGVEYGVSRVNGDFMGMLATVINAIAIHSALNKSGKESRVMSSIRMQEVCEPYINHHAHKHLNKGRIIILSSGIGIPFLTTDTAAALRAVELECELMLKGTHKVDGVYNCDPSKNDEAVFFEKISYSEILEKNLKFMDASAVTIARDNDLPMAVFSIENPSNLLSVICGKCRCSFISGGKD